MLLLNDILVLTKTTLRFTWISIHMSGINILQPTTALSLNSWNTQPSYAKVPCCCRNRDITSPSITKRWSVGKDQCLWTSYISWYMAMRDIPGSSPSLCDFPSELYSSEVTLIIWKPLRHFPVLLQNWLQNSTMPVHTLAAILCTNMYDYLNCFQHQQWNHYTR